MRSQGEGDDPKTWNRDREISEAGVAEMKNSGRGGKTAEGPQRSSLALNLLSGRQIRSGYRVESNGIVCTYAREYQR